MTNDKKSFYYLKNALIVCHDAGGAEILSSFIARNQSYFKQVEYALEGPAIKIFKKKIGDINIVNIEEAICRCDVVMSGTSWRSSLELQALKLSKKLKKLSLMQTLLVSHSIFHSTVKAGLTSP
jgi:hypothetical protein